MTLQHRKYLVTLLAYVTAVLVVTAGFNWFVDPFNLYDPPRVKGLNENKPFAYHYETQTKTYAISQFRPEGLILGNSRADFGLDPALAPWHGRGYNAAYGGGSFYGALYYLRQGVRQGKLKQVVLAIDIDMFRKGKRQVTPVYFGIDDFLHEAENENIGWNGQPRIRWWKTLLSYGVTDASVMTVRCQSAPERFVLLRSGLVLIDMTKMRETVRERFIAFEKRYFRYLYHPDDRGKAKLEFAKQKLDQYRKILDYAYAQGIEMYIVINPSHARKYEMYRVSGLEPSIYEWKRLITRINEDVAARTGRNPFPIWDFEGYNRYTTERLPLSVDATSTMKWYVEGSHYRKELGDLLLTTVFSQGHMTSKMPSDFGSLINSSNLESHFRHTRLAQENYIRSHKDDVQALEAFAREARLLASQDQAQHAQQE
jgi:hypothetical protein